MTKEMLWDTNSPVLECNNNNNDSNNNSNEQKQVLALPAL